MSDPRIDDFIAVRRAGAPAIDPAKAALLVIDMQNYQVRREWASYKVTNTVVPGLLDEMMNRVVEIAEPNIVRLVDAAHKSGMQVVYTKFSSHHPSGKDFTRQLQRINGMAKRIVDEPVFPHKDDEASDIVDSFTVLPEDLVLIKTTSGSFTCTDLEAHLKNAGVEQLVVCGVVTNMCVEGTARAGAELGFDVTIVDDACAAWSQSAHEATLRSFQMFLGTVEQTDDVLAAIASAKS